MPPVNSASTSDVDNEATAELPVLDVAAYEADQNAHTDSWAVATSVLNPVTVTAIEATTESALFGSPASASFEAAWSSFTSIDEEPAPGRGAGRCRRIGNQERQSEEQEQADRSADDQDDAAADGGGL